MKNFLVVLGPSVYLNPLFEIGFIWKINQAAEFKIF
jgi:hypothetical protein